MKKKTFFGLVCVLVFTFSGIAMAARPSFFFEVANTGQSFQPNQYGTTNSKVYANDPWSINVQSISFTDSVVGYGMGYVLYRGGMVGTRSSSVYWASYPVVSNWCSWGSYSHPTGSYQLWGRLDDQQGGICRSSGMWNADSVTTW